MEWKGVAFDMFDWAKNEVKEFFVDGFVSFMEEVAIALPVLFIVCMAIWFFFQMFSKGLAKIAVIGAFIYGVIALIGG